MRDSYDRRQALGRCVLFQALDGTGQDELASMASVRSFIAGTPIFRLGDPGDSMMAVLAGTVRISLPTQKGSEMVLADVAGGEVFGEIALLDGRPRSASATALTNCDVLVLERRAAIPLLKRHPEACLKLLQLLCGRVRRSDERMLDVGFSEIPVRLAKVLIERAALSGGRIPLSQTELANMIGATRENVNCHLRAWQLRGLLQRKKGWIVVVNTSALGVIAEEQ